MKLKSFFKRLFGGEVIERIQSPINGEISIVKELLGKTVVRVGGIAQSGGIVEKIWQKILSNIKYPISNINSVLVLGLGCGTVAEIINQKWPEAAIAGIEIDPEVIKIGRKYFELDKIKNLSIINEDAVWWIASKLSLISKNKYDLILVDLYRGQEFPKEAESEEFIDGLEKLLNKDGLIIFNRLNFGNHKARTAKFLRDLEKYFPKVSLQKTEFNLFIFATE